MRQMLDMRKCLPPDILMVMDDTLQEMRDISHHRFLTSVGLEKLSLELESGVHLCHALIVSLRHQMNRHRHVMNQKQSSGIIFQAGDGWQETLNRLRDTIPRVKDLCHSNVHPSLVSCMKSVEKEVIKKIVVHHINQ
jgi:hypothetical protein